MTETMSAQSPENHSNEPVRDAFGDIPANQEEAREMLKLARRYQRFVDEFGGEEEMSKALATPLGRAGFTLGNLFAKHENKVRVDNEASMKEIEAYLGHNSLRWEQPFLPFEQSDPNE